jgi:hypothetical protein
MLIPGVSEIGERSPDPGRWVAAARASRRRPTVPTPASVDANAKAESDGDMDDASDWTSERGMTLAAAQAAYAAN